MKVETSKYGLKHDYRSAHVSMSWQGRTLLGEITGVECNDVTGSTHFTVKHFNGEPWPVKPHIFAVDILERSS